MDALAQQLNHKLQVADSNFELLWDLPNVEAEIVLKDFFRRLLEPQLDALIKQQVTQTARQLDPERPFFNKQQTVWYLSGLSSIKLSLQK